MPTIDNIINQTVKRLIDKKIASARLDAEVLLAHTLSVDRSYLHAHSQDTLQGPSLQRFEKLIEQRLQRKPVAYITGKKEFYGREFSVNPNVLIPRPETEDLVDLILEYCHNNACETVIDVGCGSGCVGVTLKLERPELDVTLCDISPAALCVSKKNTAGLGATVKFVESDLLFQFLPSKSQNLKSKISFDVIVANLPYVDTTWETSPETVYEPQEALYADSDGCALIFKLIDQSTPVLRPGGLLALEADPEQHKRIVDYAQAEGFKLSEVRGYAMSFVRQVSQ